MESNSERLLKIEDIAFKCAYSISHTKRAIITRPDFPKPVNVVNSGDPRWLESDVNNFLKELKNGKY